jgi:signal peptidase I
VNEAAGKRRLFAAVILWAVIAFTAGLLVLVAAPRVIGGQSMAVLSDSMSPAIRTGDEVVVLPVDAAALKPGQIAVFNDPAGTGKVLQHRVQWVTTDVDRIRVITKGDANSKPERWSVPIGEDVGRVVATVPIAGYVFGRMDSPVLFVVLIAIPALLLAGSLLISIWRAPEPGGPGQATG